LQCLKTAYDHGPDFPGIAYAAESYRLPIYWTAEECVPIPFYVAGQAAGIIQKITHSDRRKIDVEDDRLTYALVT
jgi:hypothetical protein